jgi:nitrate/nitrite transporter NarK
MLATSIVDIDTLLQVIGYSLALGVGLGAVFALGVSGAAGMVEARRHGRVFAAAAYAGLVGVALTACAAAVVLGVIAMTTKS